jgi:hypothetical protein
MALTRFLNDKGFDSFEGYSQQIPRQVIDLYLLTNKPNLNVMEIGFNAGHSAEIFLEYNKNIKLTSFDLGHHTYVLPAKEYIDKTYPNRHTLIIGDSTASIPKFINDNKDTKFDIIFIDGSHEYEIAKKDIYLKYKKNLFLKGYKILLDLILSSEKRLKLKEVKIKFKLRSREKSKMSVKILILLIYFIFIKKFRKYF